MIPYSAHKSQLQKLMKDLSSETAADILLYTNISVREIASWHFFETLKKNVDLATLLPGDLERPFYIQLGDTDYLAFPVSETDRYTSGKLYNWWMNRSVADPLLTISDAAITANDTALTSVTGGFTSAMVGEFVRIGSNLGVYEIDAYVSGNEVTLAKGFRGDTETAAYCEVRPQGTEQLALTDEQGTATSVDNSSLIYQRFPLPIYNDYDMIELPGSCLAVTTMVHQRLMLGEKYDNDALKQEPSFIKQIAAMNPLAPVKGRTPRPRDRFGVPVAFGRLRNGIRTNSNDRRILGL